MMLGGMQGEWQAGPNVFASVELCLLCRKRMQDIRLAGVAELYICSKNDVLTTYEDLRQLIELRQNKYAFLPLTLQAGS